jgi:alpha-galactosidase
MGFKAAIIGAGSIGFTRRLVRDILTVPEFRGIEISLADISRKNLDMVARLVCRDVAMNGLPARIETTLDLKSAVRGAKYVINVARAGGLKAFETDIGIPLKYGVDQCVGDTLCAGGIMYGQRGIPVVLDICRAMRECAAQGAILFNYSNPMAMMTWAANKYGGVKTVGLCHGVEHGCEQIADVLGIPQAELDIICAGINHQTWYLSVKHRGVEMREKLPAAFGRHPVYSKTEKVRIDMLRRFGYYTTESNGHISEYVPWYRKRRKEIARWIDMSCWIHGETGGYLRVCGEGRKQFQESYRAWLKEPAPVFSAENRSTERVSHIIEAMETGRVYRTWFNVVNNGCISNLPPDCVIEAPGYADGNGISMTAVGELPIACAATCDVSVNVQRMAVEAAVRGDVELLKQAMLHDPLVGAVCTPPEVWRMADEMLVAQARWLPQYKQEIARAKSRLGEARY